MSRLLGLFFFVCFGGAWCRADSFQSFSFNATLTGSGIATGTLTLDETTGLFTGANLSTSFLMPPTSFSTPPSHFPSSYVFSAIQSQGDFGVPTSIDTGRELFDLQLDEPGLNNANDQYTFDLEFPNSSLVGYGGGSVCSDALDCSRFLFAPSAFIVLGSNSLVALQPVLAGALTPILSVPPTVTPEPSSLWLLGTELVGVGLVVRKRLEVA